MKLAFLVIDMQAVHFEGRVSKQTIEEACEYINYVADLVRSNGHLVIHVKDIEGMDESNKDSFEVIPQIVRETEDLWVTKQFSNAFWQTDLEQILKAHGVEFVILAGFAAEQCVLFTYNGASERGFTPVMLQGGIVSANPDVIASTYKHRNLISHPVVKCIVHR
ncbi:MAG TPA: isochorismatase family protein [Bacillales bacterium]|nr:isochorismatase family protein [Bacillales bacterium]